MPGHRAGVDVEDVADLVGERLDVCVVGALVARDPLDRDRDVLEQARDDERDDPSGGVLGERRRSTRTAGGIAG